MSAFSEQPDAVPYLPLLSCDFEHLYWLLRGNLRSALSNADNYCMWVGDRAEPQSPSDMHASYLEWLDGQSKAALYAAQAQLRPRAWQCFEKAVALDGSFSPGQYGEFGFNSLEAMRPHIKDLETAGLLQSTQDDVDKRRKTINITPKGWLVNYAKHGPERSED